MNCVDLHVHSTCSDGTYTPTELVDYAIEKGLSAFALTDHDTTSGLAEAISYAEHLRNIPTTWKNSSTSQSSPIPEVIPGIEFSTKYQDRDIHILGLFIDYTDTSFVRQVDAFKDSRGERNKKMCLRLQEAGVNINYDSLISEFPDSVITRAHYAKYLVANGYTKNIPEAFDRYIGDRAPCFVAREKVTPLQAVTTILEAKGTPILAHPVLYHMSHDQLESLVADLKKGGLMGIEAIYSTYNLGEERKMRELAAKYDLLISGGSDFHGSIKPKLDLGCGYGRLFIPNQILEDIKKAVKKI